MKLDEIKSIAVLYGVTAGKKKKAELVRAIQQVEGNEQCFATDQAGSCNQAECLWRADCN
jgi:hypothetical protein